MTRLKRTTFRVALCSILVLATGVLLEVGLRLTTPAPAFAASLNLHTNLSTELTPDLHGVAVPVHFSTNVWGMRGSPPPTGDAWNHTTTIIAVGGSTTQCFFLDDSRTWPAVMERELRGRGSDVWVGNAGQAGHTTRAHLRMVDGPIAQIRPDYVVFLVGVNDLSLSLRPKWVWDDEMSDALLGRARGRVLNWILDHSRLAYRLHLLKQTRFDGTVLRSKDFSVPLPSEPTTGDEFEPGENVDAILPSLPMFRDNVVRLIRSVRAFGATPVFLTQPLLIEDSPRWSNVRARSFWMKTQRFQLAGDSYARLLDRFNEVLRETCKAHDADCFDLAGNVPHSTEYYYDMVHYNDAGANLIGRLVAAHLERNVFPATVARAEGSLRNTP